MGFSLKNWNLTSISFLQWLIHKSQTPIFIIFLEYVQNITIAKRLWVQVHIYCHYGGIFIQKWCFCLKCHILEGISIPYGGYKQITHPNLFYFPGVFPEYYHWKKDLSSYLMPLWRYFQSKMVFLLKMSHFSRNFNSIMADIDKSQSCLFFIFLEYFQNTTIAKRFWVHIH